MSSTPNAETITVGQSLELLDGKFGALARGVAEGRYALWLGSGISLGRVAGLRQLVLRVVEFLRRRIAPTNPECRFSKALDEALDLAQLSPAERGRVDYAREFSDWDDAETIVQRLSNRYAQLLDIAVDGEPDDYLLWHGVDVASTFADASTEPDVEHLCVGILVLEGLAPEIASANWDGLLEKAVERLASGQRTMAVVVRPEDLRESPRKSRLIKFHGCAVRAVEDEEIYRTFLVARASQIHGWRQNAETQPVVLHLVGVVVSKPTLMIGLSAQDANIQAVFAEAQAQMPWPWPGDEPSCVFSGDAIGADQQTLLRNVYRDAYSSAAQAINAGALFRAYAKPLLTSLVLHVLCSKLGKLVMLAPGQLEEAGRADVCVGLVALRDGLAEAADLDGSTFIEELIQRGSRAMTMFRDGVLPAPRRYRPVSQSPIQQMDGDEDLLASGLAEAAVAAGLLGMGVADGMWSVEADSTGGVVRIDSSTRTADLYFVADSHVALRLWHGGHLPVGSDTIVVHSSQRLIGQTRSPRSAPGRTGSPSSREVSVCELMNEVTTGQALMQRFREETAL